MVNVSFPILNVQGSAIAALTVPYIKRLEERIEMPDVIAALRETSQQVSEAMGATRQS